MSPPNSAKQFHASAFEPFYEALRLCGKISQCSNNVHRLRKPGIFKHYMASDCVVVARLQMANPTQQHCLVFHRIPPGYRYCEESSLTDVNPSMVGYGPQAQVDAQTDSMFSVRYLGEGTRNVVASGVGIRSGIWFFTGENIPEPLINPTALQAAFEIGRIFAPREIDRIQASIAQQISCSESSLIERMAGVDQAFSCSSPQVAREWLNEFDFSRILSGFTIEIGDDFCRAILEERLSSGFQLGDCIICPFSRLARWRKLSSDSLFHETRT